MESWIKITFLLLYLCPLCLLIFGDNSQNATDNPEKQGPWSKCINDSTVGQLQSSLKVLSARASEFMQVVMQTDDMNDSLKTHISNGTAGTIANFWAQLTQLELFIKKLEDNDATEIEERWKTANFTTPPEPASGKLFQSDFQEETLQFSVYNLWKDVQNLKKDLSNLFQQDDLQTTRMMALASAISSLQNMLFWQNTNITFISTRTSRLENTVDNHNSDIEEMNELVVSLGSTMADEISKSHYNITALERKLVELSARMDADSSSNYKQRILKDTGKGKENIINPKSDNTPRKIKHSNIFSKLFAVGGQEQSTHESSCNEDSLRNLTLEMSQMRSQLQEMQAAHSQLVSNVSSKIVSIEARLENQGISTHGKDNQSKPQITKNNCDGLRRHLVGDSCYFVPDLYTAEHQYTWWDARYLCKQHNALGPQADLAAIETKEKMDDIIKLVSNHFGGIEEFWLGASDLDKEGTWMWAMTGQALSQDSYTNWQHVPDQNTEQNCMSMFNGYQWAAEPCFYERYPLCELKVG